MKWTASGFGPWQEDTSDQALTDDEPTGSTPEACQICTATGGEIAYSVQLGVWCCLECYSEMVEQLASASGPVLDIADVERALDACREQRSPPRRGSPQRRDPAALQAPSPAPPPSVLLVGDRRPTLGRRAQRVGRAA